MAVEVLPVDMIEAIRSSCEKCCQTSGVSILRQNFDEFLNEVDAQAWSKQSQTHGLKLPLRFSSPLDEINVLSTLSLLNFLHAYRQPLKSRTGKGAYEFVLSLVIGAYVSDEPTFLDAKSMSTVGIAQLASLGNIKTHVERRHETLPITVGEKDADVFEILELVQEALNSTGRFLVERGASNLGSWVSKVLDEAQGDVNAALRELATVPAFADIHKVDGKPVYLMKKALFLLHAVSHLVELKGYDNLPVFVDNIIPSMLYHHQLISLPESTQPPNFDEQQATKVRAASLVACQEIVKRARVLGAELDIEWMRNMTEVELDGYLWSMAKVGTARDQVLRFVERGTLYY